MSAEIAGAPSQVCKPTARPIVHSARLHTQSPTQPATDEAKVELSKAAKKKAKKKGASETETTAETMADAADATGAAAYASSNGNVKKGERLSAGDGDGSSAALPQPFPVTQRSSPNKQKGKGRADTNPALLEAVASVLRQQQLADGAPSRRLSLPCLPSRARA